MHWAVRGRKDLMLEESDQVHTNQIENEERNKQREIKKEQLGSTTEKMEQKESNSLEKSFSPQNLDSPSKSNHVALQTKKGLKLKGLVYTVFILNLFQVNSSARFKGCFITLKYTYLALTQKLEDTFLNTSLSRENVRHFWE